MAGWFSYVARRRSGMVTNEEINKENKWAQELKNTVVKPRPIEKKKVPHWLVSNRQRRIVNGK